MAELALDEYGRWHPQGVIVTTRLSLARSLWAFGEDELWPRALRISLNLMIDIGERAGAVFNDDTEARWGRRLTPAASLVIAAIEILEGEARWPALTRRRPKNRMPAELVASEHQPWRDPDMAKINEIVWARRHGS